MADEIRGLAEKTVHATGSINVIIGGMKHQLQALLDAMRTGADQVVDSRGLGDRAAGEMEQIKSLVAQSPTLTASWRSVSKKWPRPPNPSVSA